MSVDATMYGWARCDHSDIGKPGCPTCDPSKMRVGQRYEFLLDAERAKVAKLQAALQKISDIRNSIVGCQCFNWSEHAYPLVATLNEAGFEGEKYETARARLGTLIEQNTKLEAEKATLVEHLRNVTDNKPCVCHRSIDRSECPLCDAMIEARDALKKVGAL